MPRNLRRAGLLLIGLLLISCSASRAASPKDRPPPPPCAVTKHALKTLAANTPLPAAGHAVTLGQPVRLRAALIAHYSVAPIGQGQHDCYRAQLQGTYRTRAPLPVNLPGLVGAAAITGPAGTCKTGCAVAIALEYSAQTQILKITEAAYPETR